MRNVFQSIINRSSFPAQVGVGMLVMSAATVSAATGNPRINQLGYLPGEVGIASYKTEAKRPVKWKLLQNGKVVAKGKTTLSGVEAASGDNLQHIDLRAVKATGTGFTLSVADDTSYPFAINSEVFSGASYDALRYFYHNRSGIAIETRFTGGGLGSYATDAKWARPAGHISQGVNQGDLNVPCIQNTCNYTLNVTKGWYDAGDHAKYVVNGGISAWELLNMYERQTHLSQSTSLKNDNLNIPESGNGIPDILDEARWEVDFMLAMQVPIGQPKAGMVHHKIQDEGWTGFPLAPHQDTKKRSLIPPSTAATLNLAAVAAQSSRIWKSLDPSYSAICLTAATRAWDAAKVNPEVFYTGTYDNGGGAYGDTMLNDDFYWAAAELYITTGDAKYLVDINGRKAKSQHFDWQLTDLAGVISLATVPTPATTTLRSAAQLEITTLAKHWLGIQDQSGYSSTQTVNDYDWGSNGQVANNLVLIGLAHDFTGEKHFAEGVIKGVDYLLGRNVFQSLM